MATDMKASGTAEEKLKWAFKMYDEDGSGKVLILSVLNNHFQIKS